MKIHTETFSPPEHMESRRLCLRRPKLSDARALYEFSSDQKVVQWLEWPKHASISTTEAEILSYQALWETANVYYWVIEKKAQNRVIGGFACRIKGVHADLGFALKQNAWGQGYASEAGRLIVDWLVSLPSLERIAAVSAKANPASGRVLEKLGFQLAGVVPGFLTCPNAEPTQQDAGIYSIDVFNHK